MQQKEQCYQFLDAYETMSMDYRIHSNVKVLLFNSLRLSLVATLIRVSVNTIVLSTCKRYVIYEFYALYIVEPKHISCMNDINSY